MESTGVFTKAMKKFFGAKDGAYTSFTEVELEKSTYNVKSDIRKLLIRRMGRKNIPVVNKTKKQNIRFIICDKAKIYGRESLDIPCKFSKKDKDEMTIYFNRNTIDLMSAKAGDIWYIYFQKKSKQPVLGILSKEKWRTLFEDDEIIEKPDEISSHKLRYTSIDERLQLDEVAVPERKAVQEIKKEGKTVKSVSAEEAARREKNRKVKGMHGEEIAIEIEKRRLTAIGRTDLISKITHVAKVKDGLGYDIISTDIDSNGKEQEIYIEVKATVGDENTPFYVTKREIEVARRYKELYYIYRIFNMKENSNSAKYYRLCGAIEDNYDLTATNYMAYRSGQ